MCALSLRQIKMEKCLSGLRCSSRKRVWVTPPQVQILSSPPQKATRLFLFWVLTDLRARDKIYVESMEGFMTIEQAIDHLRELKAQFMPLEKERARLVNAAIEGEAKLNNLPDQQRATALTKMQPRLKYFENRVAEIDDAREELIAQISKCVRELMNENFISSEQFCELLTAQTGLKWVPAKVGGEAIKNVEKEDKTIERKRHIYFGQVLVNENHIDFRDKDMYKCRVFDNHFSQKSIAAAVGHVSGREQSQEYRSGALREKAESRTQQIADSFNWLFYYLYLKDCFPENLTPKYYGKLKISDELFKNWPEYPYLIKTKSRPSKQLENIEANQNLILSTLDQHFGLKNGVPRKRV